MTKVSVRAIKDLELEYLVESVENKIQKRFHAMYHVEYFESKRGFKAIVNEVGKEVAEKKIATMKQEIGEMEIEIKWFEDRLKAFNIK